MYARASYWVSPTLPRTSVARRNSSLVGLPSATAVSSTVGMGGPRTAPAELNAGLRHRLGELQEGRAPEQGLDFGGSEESPRDQELADRTPFPLGLVEDLGDLEVP